VAAATGWHPGKTPVEAVSGLRYAERVPKSKKIQKIEGERK